MKKSLAKQNVLKNIIFSLSERIDSLEEENEELRKMIEYQNEIISELQNDIQEVNKKYIDEKYEYVNQIGMIL